jgi:hypothetical protein
MFYCLIHSRNHVRTFLSLLVILGLLTTGCNSPQVKPSQPGSTDTSASLPQSPVQPTEPGSQPASSTPKTPEEVAVALSKAATPKEALAGLEMLFQQVGAGLYTADGTQVVAGAEKGPDDFYLYQGEAELLAQAFVDGQQFPVDRLARFVEEAGYGDLNVMKGLTAEQMLAGLGDAVSRARTDSGAFTFRVVDLLGKAHKQPLDLTQPGLDPRTTYLDSAQLFLVLYDMLADESGASAAHRSIYLAASKIRKNALDPCSFSGIPDQVRKAGFFAASQLFKFRNLINLGKGVSIAGQTLDSLHDALIMLGYTVTLEPQQPTPSTHWKHEPNEPGRDVKYTAHVDFDLGKLNGLAKCGHLAGFSFPDQGASKDVAVEWEKAPVLEKQGAWQESANTYKTDANGDAVINFSPKVEPRPKEGLNRTEHGWVEVRIMPRSNFNPRKVFDLLGVGPEFHMAHAGLEVSRHAPFSMKIGGKLSSPDGFVSMIFPETTFPLTVGSTEITGGGDLTAQFELNGLPAFCKSDAGAPMKLNISGKGMDPIQFSIGGMANIQIKIRCEAGGQWVEADSSQFPQLQGFTPGDSVEFSLAAKDGEVYQFKAPGYDGSLDFTLLEE